MTFKLNKKYKSFTCPMICNYTIENSDLQKLVQKFPKLEKKLN
jgi:hypothetical protein